MKNTNYKYLQKLISMFERTMKPLFSGSIDLKINKLSPLIAKQVSDYRRDMMNKGKESTPELEKKAFNLDDYQLSLVNQMQTLLKK